MSYTLPKKKVEGETVKENLTENAYQRILPARYLNKDEDGDVEETPEEMFTRVANNVAAPEEDHDLWASRFYDMMTNLEFMPNSPTLMNAGTEMQQLSACFVQHPEDSMESIFQTAKDAAMIFKSGGGVGYPFHLLRPKGDLVSSTGGVSSGPMSFMQVFDSTCGTVKQGGKRRGAQMGIMRVDHPDILRFIVSKRKEGNLSNFNISVGLTHNFMEAVKEDEEYTCYNPAEDEVHEVTRQTAEFYNSSDEYHPEASGSDTGKDDNFWRDFAENIEGVDKYDIELEPGEEMTLPARFIWNVLVDGAWRNGEPGLYMYDTANDMHSFDIEKHPEYKMEATNPCAEQPLIDNEQCNLGHINLSLLVEENAKTWEEWKETEGIEDHDLETEVRHFIQNNVEVERLERIARHGTRFLDNVVDMSEFPLEEIEEMAKSTRKIGLGLMGFAQMLIQLGVRYGSDVSVEIAKEMQRLITKYSVEMSHELAQEKGTFKDWDKSKWANPSEHPDWFYNYSGFKDLFVFEDGYEMRNHNAVTIAPTGTTSMIANTSGGCEPIFSIAYFKNVAKDIQGEDMLVEFDDYFLRTLEANNLEVEEIKEEAERLMRNDQWEGVDSLPDEVLPPKFKDLFITSDRVTPEEHVKIQGAFQDHNHSGISKTCNFDNDATREDVEKAYLQAYDEGIKGLTVYRDGTRETQVMQTNTGGIEQKISTALDDARREAGTPEEAAKMVADILDINTQWEKKT